MKFLQFIFYFFLFLFAFRLLRNWLNKIFRPSDEQKVYEQKSTIKKRTDEIEEVEFTEIKNDTDKKN